jgi:hypothetical protein
MASGVIVETTDAPDTAENDLLDPPEVRAEGSE